MGLDSFSILKMSLMMLMLMERDGIFCCYKSTAAVALAVCSTMKSVAMSVLKNILVGIVVFFN